MQGTDQAPVEQQLAITALKPHPENPRRGDVDGIMESLGRFGQVRPIVVQGGTGIVVAGNHTLEAARRLGWENIWAVMVQLSDEDALAYLLADNRLADKASYDDAVLLEALRKLNASGDLTGIGYSQDDMDDLVSAIEGVEESPDEGFTGDFAEPEGETAARWEGRNEGARREVVFLLLEEDFVNFRSMCEDLKKEWQLESLADTIFQAVRTIHEHEVSG